MQHTDGETLFPFLAGTPYTAVQLPRGAVVFSEGDACGRIGFLVRGAIKVYKLAESGREVTLYRIGRGESCILTMSCALATPVYRASAVVEEDAELLLLALADFRRLVETSQEARHFVFGLFSHRMADLLTLVEEIAFRRVDERLAELLLHHLRDGVVTTTHERLALELGSAREVVSRVLKEFEHEGMVRLGRGKITVEQPDRLRRLCPQRSLV